MHAKLRLFTLCLALAGMVTLILAGTMTNTVSAQNRGNKLQPFKVAAIQFNPILNERDKNVDELLSIIEQAFKNGAKLVVAPEMSTTGYYYRDREAIRPFVDTIPGTITKRVGNLTSKYNAYAVFGMAEKDARTDLFYNAAALVGPAGYIGKYRKTHQWETEEHWAAWGDLGVPVFTTGIGRIDINICMDSAYFESARLAALGGVDILAFPTNSSAQAIAALPARAQQNGLYIVSANRSNTENGFHMIGASAIWSPTGVKLAEAPLAADKSKAVAEPMILYGIIDPQAYKNKNKQILATRRPELYKDLMLYIAPWDYTKNTIPHDLRAGIVQYEPVVGDKTANKAKVARLISAAVEQARRENNSLDIIVLPELSLTGPMDKQSIAAVKSLAEPADGGSAGFMAELAKTSQVAIVYGLIEQAGNKLYNAAIVVDKAGSEIGKYRKTHLSDSDKRWATAGDRLAVFSAPELGKFGLLIGEDALYPEAAGVLAVKRADFIAIPAAWHGQYGSYMTIHPDMSANKYPAGSMVIWDAAAIGAQAYTLVANFMGTTAGYSGHSSLYTLDPLYGLDQPAVAAGDKEEVLVVNFKTIQPQWWFNQEKLLLSRRTPYYVPLVQ
ncbi:nitrilase-related carbon-nitrogen hydrolase [Sporomusa termitida]|uniref:Formamidase n=1 Tax=Sporomusa termitida TaxID=2377 RepID=A0A517DQS1_9FIRM|nr:nitrilase-related carbon-nitrogen hydrolase [Sporomusa termitida]QDR79700.1 Formamidase [Sporomusa termitida]